jgi:hypothetical protein
VCNTGVDNSMLKDLHVCVILTVTGVDNSMHRDLHVCGETGVDNSMHKDLHVCVILTVTKFWVVKLAAASLRYWGWNHSNSE